MTDGTAGAAFRGPWSDAEDNRPEPAPARLPGPADREHFLDVQRRHRRRTWRAAALGIPAVMAAGIPLCVIVTPMLLAPIMAAAFVLHGLGALPPEALAWIYRIAHLLPDTWSAIWDGGYVSPVLLVATFVLPGAVVMFGVWLALRLRLGKAWIASVLARLGGRLPDANRLSEKRLCNIAEELAVAAGVRPPRVLVIDSAAANATVVGHDLEEATLLVSTGLLETLDRAETQALVGHLIASIGNGDLRIAATFFSVFEAWGALALMIETPFNGDARGALGRVARTLRDPRREPDAAREVLDDLLDGAAAESRGFEAFMDRIEAPSNPLRNMLIDLPLAVTAGIFAVTARFSITLCTALLFGPPISALWRSRRRLADAGAVELTRQPEALASAVEKLHGANVEVPGGEPVSFLFPVWPKPDLEGERVDVAFHVLGMQLDPHKRLQALRRMGSGREVTIKLDGWEGWAREIREVPVLLLWVSVALALLAFMFGLTLAAMGGALLLLWKGLELALVTFPAWVAALF